jgi:galactose mutarotase-like enzyme
MTTAPETLRLSCGDTVVTIAPQRGALVTSFLARNREWLYLDQATFNDRSKNVRGGIPILFPSPGKLESDRWQQAGKSGELKQHGFARNLEWTIDAQHPRSPASVTLSIQSTQDTLQAFAWRFAVRATFTVEHDALNMRFLVTNEDSMPMPFAFGLHPYFLVPDNSRAHIATRASRAFDNVAKRDVPFVGFDFSMSEVDLHLLDHGSASARLELGQEAISIDCSPEFTRWIVWSLPGKDFICLEPWSAPGNALNTGEDVITLAPAEHRELRVRISVC